MPAPSDPSPEMLNDPDGRQLVAAIHARRAGKTTAAKDAHLMFITTRAEAVRKWMATDLDEPRNLAGLQRALDAQVGDVDYLVTELRKRDEALARVETVLNRMDEEHKNALAGESNCAEVNYGAGLMAYQAQTYAYRQASTLLRNALKPTPTTTGEPS